MVDMFLVYRTIMEMMREYNGINVSCNYCPICGTMQIDFGVSVLDIFEHHQQRVTATEEALTVLYKLFYDFILQPDIVKYLREGAINDNIS